MATATDLERSLPGVSPQPIQRVWTELQSLATQDLAQPALPAAAFLTQSLSIVARGLEAVAAAIWTPAGQGLEPHAQWNLAQVRELTEPAASTRHALLLERAMTSGQALQAKPHAQLREDARVGNPTEFVVVLAPLALSQTAAVLEVFLPVQRASSADGDELLFLLELSKWLADHLKDRELQALRTACVDAGHVEQLGRMVHSSLRLKDTASHIANELRRMLACDRVSLASLRHGQCRLEAVSGQDVFDRRSTTVRSLQALATHVARSSQPITFRGDSDSASALEGELLQTYLDEAHVRSLLAMPLTPPRLNADESPAATAIGVVLIEQFRDAQPDLQRQAEPLLPVCAQALANALRHDGQILAPASRFLEGFSVLRKSFWTKIALAVVLSLVLFAVLMPADFQLEGRGTLEPKGRKDVFAAVSGVVSQVYVDHGESVPVNGLLLELRNHDLEVQLAELQGREGEATERLATLQETLLRANRMSTTELNRLHGEREQALVAQAAAREEREKVQEKAEQLRIRSPVAGQVVTWNAKELLTERPVGEGQNLISVADVAGDWELDVLMPEDRMGHIVQARETEGAELPVTFILATEPGRRFEGVLREVEARADVHEGEGNVVRLRVAIDKSQLGTLRRGASVVAKVHCGRRSLAYVWFHEVAEFVQSRILFRL